MNMCAFILQHFLQSLGAANGIRTCEAGPVGCQVFAGTDVYSLPASPYCVLRFNRVYIKFQLYNEHPKGSLLVTTFSDVG